MFLYNYLQFKVNRIFTFSVTYATSAIFAYWWLMPSLLYGLLWFRGNQAGYTFTELVCVYGYSLAVYIPISVSSPLSVAPHLAVYIPISVSSSISMYSLAVYHVYIPIFVIYIYIM